jgi:glycosyltransferase involved in cell wall biosynthesis
MAQDPLHLLCVEPRFPGRLGAVADWLVRKRGYRCRFYCHAADSRDCWPQATGNGLEVVLCNLGGVAREAAVPWTRCLERGLCYTYACWEVLEARRPRPVDLVLGRSAGLGSTLFVPAALPGVHVVNLFDYFHHPHAHDLAGEAPPETPPDYFHWRRAANAMDLLDLENGVTPWAPTRWQRDLFPPEYRDDFTVLFDGVRLVSRPPGPRTVAGRPIPAEARVVTFVARYLDRVRGFDRFLAVADRLLREGSDVLCLVVGDAIVQRGLDVPFFNQDYRAHLLRQMPPCDPSRLWFLGAVPPAVVDEVLAAGDLHVYPSRPYPVSRSLLEALTAGCVVLAWDTEPVREFLSHGHNALLVQADDLDAQVRQALAVLRDVSGRRCLGARAAAWARERCSQDVALPALATLFDRLAATP